MGKTRFVKDEGAAGQARWWRLRLHECRYCAPQCLQLKWTPLRWTMKWVTKVAFWRNLLLHVEQAKGRSPVWIRSCLKTPCTPPFTWIPQKRQVVLLTGSGQFAEASGPATFPLFVLFSLILPILLFCEVLCCFLRMIVDLLWRGFILLLLFMIYLFIYLFSWWHLVAFNI